jgi:hypothetical protein
MPGAPCPGRGELADAVFYGPIGLLLDAQTVAPDLARRGRQHVKAARIIGEMAVKSGLGRLNGFLAEPTPPPEPAPSKGRAAPARPPSPDPDGVVPDLTSLAIPRYDTLAASQIVARLDALSTAELDSVAAYERAHRGRRTILAKISRLQSPP